jgi:aspartokinase-like uncharacterized kinase
MTPPVRVVKVGGSLGVWPDLGELLARWLADQSPMINVLIAGGGIRVDGLREIDRSLGLDPVDAHWTAVRMMRLTALELAQRLAAARLIDSFAALQVAIGQCHEPTGLFVFDPHDFLVDVEPTMPGTRLPIGWEVTSDSIAARVAVVLRVRELVLLKSTNAPSTIAQELANDGLVDSFFPSVAKELGHWRFENLRTWR